MFLDVLKLVFEVVDSLEVCVVVGGEVQFVRVVVVFFVGLFCGG